MSGFAFSTPPFDGGTIHNPLVFSGSYSDYLIVASGGFGIQSITSASSAACFIAEANGSGGYGFYATTSGNATGLLVFVGGTGNCALFTTVNGTSIKIDQYANLITNASGTVLAQNATTGWFYLSQCATGAPSGTPASITGAVPMGWGGDGHLYGWPGGTRIQIDGGGGATYPVAPTGQTATSTGTASLAAGGGASTGSQLGGTAIGANSTVGSTGGVALGFGAQAGADGGATYSTALGISTVATGGNYSVALGAGATTTAANQFVLGSDPGPISSVYLGGNGVTDATPSAVLWTITGASGANVAGSTLTIAGSASTGTADGGSVAFQVSPPGSSGSSLNTLVTALAISGHDGGVTLGAATGGSMGSGTLNVSGGLYVNGVAAGGGASALSAVLAVGNTTGNYGINCTRATGNSAYYSAVTGDAGGRWYESVEGHLYWGDGTGTGGPSGTGYYLGLSRGAGNNLTLDNAAGSGATFQPAADGVGTLGTSTLRWNGAWFSSNVIDAVSSTSAGAFTVQVSGDSSARMYISGDGTHYWGNGSGSYAGVLNASSFTGSTTLTLASTSNNNVILNAGSGAIDTTASQIKLTAGTTGSGTALLGTNCPATTTSAPYTWLKFKASDGSQVYVPGWK